jgi:hypothetical protein
MNLTMVPFEGVEINLGGTPYIVPGLSLGQLKRFKETMKQIDAIAAANSASDIPDSVVDDICTVIHAALLRNYPDLTAEQLMGFLDTNNMREILPAVMGVSGLKKVRAPSAQKETPIPTGAGSTPASSQQPGGPGSTSTNT